MAGEIQRTGWHLASGAVLDFMEINDGDVAKRVGAQMVGVTFTIPAQGTAVADPAGGAVIDAEARLAVTQLLASLRAAGVIAT